MQNKTADKLKSVFDKYDKKQSEAQKEQERIKTEHEIFLEHFDETISKVIRPTMEELCEAIKSRGHNCEITQGKESKDEKGRTISAQIKMEIHPDGKRPSFGQPGRCPAISFIADTYANKVWTDVSTMLPGRGGSAGKRNEYNLENITSEIVEEEVIHLLSECFGK